MFEAYITNTALYPLMGIEVGTTVHFPMTTQELQAALAKIGMRQSWNRWRSAALWGVRPLATNSKPGKRLPSRQRQSGL